MSQSGLHNACTCARCLALRPARVIGFNPDLAAPYDTARYDKENVARRFTGSLDDYQKQMIRADALELRADHFEARSDATETYHDKANWWRPEREARIVQEYVIGVFELSLTIMAALGLALIVWAIHEAAR